MTQYWYMAVDAHLHRFESSLYLSAAPLMATFAPLWMLRILSKGLILDPLEDYAGFGSWFIENSFNHYTITPSYIGNLVLVQCGTNNQLDQRNDSTEEREAVEQARHVGQLVLPLDIT